MLVLFHATYFHINVYLLMGYNSTGFDCLSVLFFGQAPLKLTMAFLKGFFCYCFVLKTNCTSASMKSVLVFLK